MDAYLVMTAGEQVGTAFALAPDREHSIGRDPRCAIVLSDPRCSRRHAVLLRLQNGWHVKDSNSRNGTFVDDQRVQEAMLVEGQQLRIGATRFSFHVGQPPPVADDDPDVKLTQTVVMDTPVQAGEPAGAASRTAGEQGQESVLLYQLSVGLLGCDDSLELARAALEMVHQRTHAAAVGFSEVDREGRLQPRLVIPMGTSASLTLSPSLRGLVVEQGHAVWITNQASESSGRERAPKHCADAVCVPLVSQGKTLGALHVYLDRARFRQSDFDFAISVSNLLAAALARVRRAAGPPESVGAIDRDEEDTAIVGESRRMMQLKASLNGSAMQRGRVLIRGPYGSGKRHLGRVLHRAGPRADRPLVKLHCAALCASTGQEQLDPDVTSIAEAGRDCIERFRRAHLGTLLLAEVDQLSLEGQDVLLRILKGRPLQLVGENEELYLDVHVIATTSSDLEGLSDRKHFRPDLITQLAALELEMPPLEERGRDIDLLIDHFLARFRMEHGRRDLVLSRAARGRLRANDWPGNVRQLRNAIDSAVLAAQGPSIEVEHLPLPSQDDPSGSLDLDEWQRSLIGQALRRTGGNVEEAARLLGIGRATLYRKIEQYGISR